MIRVAMAALALSAGMAHAGPLDAEITQWCQNGVDLAITARDGELSRDRAMKLTAIVGGPIPYGEATMRAMFTMVYLDVDKYAVKAYCVGEMSHQLRYLK